MPYSPIIIDRDNLTIMDVPFPDLESLESIAYAIGTNMFEGFQPTQKGILIIRNYFLGLITLEQLTTAAKGRTYEE
jgi:putative transcriptional regulator